MTEALAFNRIQFRNYKALREFDLTLRHFNVLTGKNNAGKSTIIGALRLLESAIRRAHLRRPDVMQYDGKPLLYYPVSQTEIPVSLENVHSDYTEEDSEVAFTFRDGRKLRLRFPQNGGAFMIAEVPGTHIPTTAAFKKHFPIRIVAVPTLGPIDHREALVEKETVQRSLRTHRASSHFRNYWRHFPSDFDEFSQLLCETWPGSGIGKPETFYQPEASLQMYCTEDRIARELYWAGFGFQVWCQMLTHLVRSRDAQLIVIDEPEIYLHPELQRQLLWTLRGLGPDVVIATHSSEIINDSDAPDIVLIDKTKRKAQRIRRAEEVQAVLGILGSNHNVVLSQLSRTRSALFVEGEDAKLLRAFAKKLGLTPLATGSRYTVIPIGGIGNVHRVEALVWALNKTMATQLDAVAIVDRDYYCDDELEELLKALRKAIRLAHVHERKELENYLIVPSAIQRAVSLAVAHRTRRGGTSGNQGLEVEGLMKEIAESLRDEIETQLAAKYSDYRRPFGQDQTTAIREARMTFRKRWESPGGCWTLVPGKEFLAQLNQRLQQQCRVSLTPLRIVDSMRVDEVPGDLAEALRELAR